MKDDRQQSCKLGHGTSLADLGQFTNSGLFAGKSSSPRGR